MSEELLLEINTKLNALLAITVDQYLRNTELARPLHPSVDSMLRASGLSSNDIATLLGKTERAVRKKIKADEDAKAERREARTRGGK